MFISSCSLQYHDFYPRSPCGERPSWCRTRFIASTFLSTLSLRRATASKPGRCRTAGISIHALLAESDHQQAAHAGAGIISIHALLAESDFRSAGWNPGFRKFLSTLSLRRATPVPPEACMRASKFLSTLSLRRATVPEYSVEDSKEFLSTLSLRRATAPGSADRATSPDFYPRSPCGERLAAARAVAVDALISIHALLAESDFSSVTTLRLVCNFYPRSPCGERPDGSIRRELRLPISIHALLAESDRAYDVRVNHLI